MTGLGTLPWEPEGLNLGALIIRIGLRGINILTITMIIGAPKTLF